MDGRTNESPSLTPRRLAVSVKFFLEMALDHDLGCKEKYTPCGIVDEDSAQLAMVFGSSYKTSDFIVDTLEAKWNRLEEQLLCCVLPFLASM